MKIPPGYERLFDQFLGQFGEHAAAELIALAPDAHNDPEGNYYYLLGFYYGQHDMSHLRHAVTNLLMGGSKAQERFQLGIEDGEGNVELTKEPLDIPEVRVKKVGLFQDVSINSFFVLSLLLQER
jgi:hypothetical protein